MSCQRRPATRGSTRSSPGWARLSGLPVSDHVAVFEEAFSGLEAALGAVDAQ
ncbi:hypothetical protein ACFSTC_23070 [Nonomuraea ferruginea]